MVALGDDYFRKFPINCRIKVYEDYGTVKYIGEVKGYPGIWMGVEWDDCTRGKHDGFVNGIRYFQTENPNSGSMIRPGKISEFQSLEEAIKERYLIQSENPLDEDLMRETQECFGASVFEIVGMEEISKKQSCMETLTDISVEYSMTNSSGILNSFNNLTVLNLTSTLIWNWNIVSDIAKQIPSLSYINLSSNRLQLPTENDIENLASSFRHIKHINLRKCGLKNWQNIIQTARLWPYLETLALQDNDIENISSPDCTQIFKNLQEIDLHLNKLSNFNEICKLGNIPTLKSLLLMENDIQDISLPDCDSDKKLTIFPALQNLNLYRNPLSDESTVLNELSKLPALNSLCKTPNQKTGYEDMFSKAVALIPNLISLNKIMITKEQRKGAEYDIWKKYGLEWTQIEKNNTNNDKEDFCKRFRAYPFIVEKYGSPAEFSLQPAKKISNLVKIRILNKLTGEFFEKKLPRKMSVQTLHGLIIKHFKSEQNIPKLSYIDIKHPKLIVELDNLSKNLDYYSIQDGNTVMVEW